MSNRWSVYFRFIGIWTHLMLLAFLLFGSISLTTRLYDSLEVPEHEYVWANSYALHHQQVRNLGYEFMLDDKLTNGELKQLKNLYNQLENRKKAFSTTVGR